MSLTIGRAIKDENGDRLFVKNGRSWRARVAVTSVTPTLAPTRGSPELAPSGAGVSVSVALLDEAGKVARDELEQLLVFGANTLTVSPGDLARSDFDSAAEILVLVHERIGAAEAEIAGRMKLAEALTRWGASVRPAEPTPAPAAQSEPAEQVEPEPARARTPEPNWAELTSETPAQPPEPDIQEEESRA